MCNLHFPILFIRPIQNIIILAFINNQIKKPTALGSLKDDMVATLWKQTTLKRAFLQFRHCDHYINFVVVKPDFNHVPKKNSPFQ